MNVNSPAQQATRANFSAASKSWAGLTDSQRQAWSSYAALHPIKDSLGQTGILSGFQMYVSVNGSLATAFGTQTSVVPSSAAPVVGALTVASTTHTAVSVTLDTVTPDPLAALIVRTSPPLSAGRAFNGDFRIVQVCSGVVGGDELLNVARLQAKWGVLSAGQKFFISATPILADGTTGSPVVAQVTLT